jgi:hypothetical protein
MDRPVFGKNARLFEPAGTEDPCPAARLTQRSHTPIFTIEPAPAQGNPVDIPFHVYGHGNRAEWALVDSPAGIMENAQGLCRSARQRRISVFRRGKSATSPGLR